MSIKNTIIKATFSTALSIMSIFPIDKKKIIAWNFGGNQGYGDSPKYIMEALCNSETKYKLYWIINRKQKNTCLPNGVKRVIKYSPKYFYHIATSHVWIFNTRTDEYFKKRKILRASLWVRNAIFLSN